MAKKAKRPSQPGVQCRVQNLSPAVQVVYNNAGKMVEIRPGQTVQVSLTQATIDQMKPREIATKLSITEAPKEDKLGSASLELDGTGDYANEELPGLNELGGDGGSGDDTGGFTISADDVKGRLDEINMLLDMPPSNFAKFKSRAKKLFGDAWPGDGIKKDEVIALLKDAKSQLEALLETKQEA